MAPEPAPLPQILKVVFLGDSKIGKSNLITTYTSNYYTGEYIETAEEVYTKTVQLVDQGSAQLIIYDIGGGSVASDLISFLGVQGPIDVFVLCFKLGDAASLKSVETRWKRIVDHVGKHVPVMVVGLRLDEFEMSSSVIGSAVASVVTSVGASAYCECSALKWRRVETVFRMVLSL